MPSPSREARAIGPEVVAAIGRLRASGVLSGAQAALFERVARRGLVSVRLEIRALLYGGVLLLASGVGLLLAAHHRQIGPLAIAAAVALAGAGCLWWVARSAPPFSWGEVPAPSLAFDYVLLLGLLLLAADLGYLEAQLGVLGPRWPHHLLVVAVGYLAAAYRWDSRIALGLALSSLAAWGGVSIGLAAATAWPGRMLSGTPWMAGRLRATAVVLGLLYLAAAALSVRLARKAHFEEIYGAAGLLLLLGGLLSGVLGDGANWPVWLGLLLLAAAGVIQVSLRLGRSLYLALAVAAAYAGLLRPLFAPFGSRPTGVPFLLAALAGAGALWLIFAAHRRMRPR